jgi:hypothetical protein
MLDPQLSKPEDAGVPPRVLRQFAALWLCFFLGLAGWQGLLRQHAGGAAVFAGLALALGPLGLARPEAVRPVFLGATALAFPVGWVMSHFLLASCYYGLFTPVGLLFRLGGRDALSLRFRPDRQSYWTPRPETKDVRSYFHQS